MCFNFFKKNKQTVPQLHSQPETPVAQTYSNAPDEAEVQKDFEFMLTTENAIRPDGHNEICEPTTQQLAEATEVLKIAEENFIILTSGTPINGISFVQATGYDRTDNTVYAEAQRKEVANGQVVYRIYSRTMPVGEFIHVMNNFLQKSTPNLNDWDYLMDV